VRHGAFTAQHKLIVHCDVVPWIEVCVSTNECSGVVALTQSAAYTSFKEWNPDPVIHQTAEKLYGHIDNLELYVGLQAEEPK
jgi:hypothetical protein